MTTTIDSQSSMDLFINNNEYVLADFHAVWCGPCKAIAPFVHALPSKYTKLKVCTIDVDQVQETATKYGVRGMPTFLLFHNGTAVKKIVGANSDALDKAVSGLPGILQ